MESVVVPGRLDRGNPGGNGTQVERCTAGRTVQHGETRTQPWMSEGEERRGEGATGAWVTGRSMGRYEGGLVRYGVLYRHLSFIIIKNWIYLEMM